jgi:hypothetical protein
MQQNLILAATLLVGVLFAPHNFSASEERGLDKWIGGAHAETSYGTAASLSRGPEMPGVPDLKPAVTPVIDNAETSRVRPGVAGSIPTAVVGDWYWSSSHSAANVESSRFTFRPDGRYPYQYVVRKNDRGRAVESTTFEEGTVSFRKDGTFVMFPEQGNYRGNTGNGNVNRNMDEAELGRRTFHWEWRGENGRRRLYLGPDETSAAVYRMLGGPVPSVS